MRQVSTQKRQAHSPETGELWEKIRELRTGLRLLQSQFAEKMGVSRTQVVAWERPSGPRPSTDHLLKMAKLATDPKSQLWFLERAGVDRDFWGSALGRQLREQVVFDPNAFLGVPIIESPADLRSAVVADSTAPRLPWFVNALPHPECTFALRASWGSSVPDPELSFVVVDAFPRDGWTLLGKWVAVYFRTFALGAAPDVTEAFETMNDSELEEFLRRKRPRGRTVAGATMLEGFFVGPLTFQIHQFRHRQNVQLPWSVGLQMRDENGAVFVEPISHLSSKDSATCKLEDQLRPGCELIGEVIGWTR